STASRRFQRRITRSRKSPAKAQVGNLRHVTETCRRLEAPTQHEDFAALQKPHKRSSPIVNSIHYCDLINQKFFHPCNTYKYSVIAASQHESFKFDILFISF